MESTGSSSNSQQPQLPPGFRFHPTDEELVVHYLKRKASSIPLPVTIIADVDLYKFDPWELPGKATFGEQEWYFFSPRDRKYPNGARPNRAATSGYWKATGTDKPILTSVGNHKVGVKKALVFYGGRPPRGVKTNWIMHEYRLTDTGGSTKPALPATDIPKKSSLRLDDWVLCRIYKKNSQRFAARDKGEGDDKILPPLPQSQDLDPPMSNISLLENDVNFFDGLLARVMDDNNIHCNGDSANDQLRASSSTSKPSLNVALVPFKRPNASSSACWLDEFDQPPAKRLSSNSDSCSGGVMRRASLTAMLNQLPQGIGASYPNQNLITSLGQGIFRQNCQLSSMNWDS